jgi:predicted 3-demethylubiquinone-9 3-methyltransferase (glyoxalase superfamily)
MPARTRTATPPQKRCVIIGDVRESRLLDNWTRVFNRIQTHLAVANRRFASDILISFGPTVGDEFQGVLKTPRKAYDACVALRSGIPTRLRIGIGTGAVERRFARDKGMRGTAFYGARAAIEACKKLNRAILVRSAAEPTATDVAINTLLHVAASLEERWTPRQQQLLGFYREHPGWSYDRLGNRFQVTKQAVSQILAAADWDTFLEAEAAIRTLLGNDEAFRQAVKLQGFTSGSKAPRIYND